MLDNQTNLMPAARTNSIIEQRCVFLQALIDRAKQFKPGGIPAREAGHWMTAEFPPKYRDRIGAANIYDDVARICEGIQRKWTFTTAGDSVTGSPEP